MPCPTVERFLELCFNRNPPVAWVGFDTVDKDEDRIRIRIEKNKQGSPAGFLWVAIPEGYRGSVDFATKAGWWLNEAFKLGPERWREAFDNPECPEEITHWAGVNPTRPKIPREAPCIVSYDGTPFKLRESGCDHYSISAFSEEVTPILLSSVCPRCNTPVSQRVHPLFLLRGFNMEHPYYFRCASEDCDWRWKSKVRVTLGIEAVNGS